MFFSMSPARPTCSARRRRLSEKSRSPARYPGRCPASRCRAASPLVNVTSTPGVSCLSVYGASRSSSVASSRIFRPRSGAGRPPNADPCSSTPAKDTRAHQRSGLCGVLQRHTAPDAGADQREPRPIDLRLLHQPVVRPAQIILHVLEKRGVALQYRLAGLGRRTLPMPRKSMASTANPASCSGAISGSHAVRSLRYMCSNMTIGAASRSAAGGG